jgi:hypothetical protein
MILLDRLKRAGRATAPAPHRLELNAAVNFELEGVFIAVPKTGTTSVRSQISPPGPYLIPNPHLNLMQVRDCLYPYYLLRAFGRNRGFPSEGVMSDAEVRAQAGAAFERFFKFSSVRNPWARAVSLYFRGEGVKPSETMSFEAFCERHLYASDTCTRPTLHRDQADWLVDETGAIAVDYVYKVEEFAASIDEIRERSGGRIRLQPLQENVNARSRSERYREVYTDRSRQLIARRFERDIDLFGYVF